MIIVNGIPGWYFCEKFFEAVILSAPEKAHFVEAGTLFGSASNGLCRLIAKHQKDIQVTLIDAFKYENLGRRAKAVIASAGFEPNDAGFRTTFDAFRKGKAHEDSTVVEGESPKIAGEFANGSIDMLMLDNSHDGDHLLKELKAWYPKVKSGGYLAVKVAGFIDGKLNQHEGVQEALQQTFDEDDIIRFDEIVWCVQVDGDGNDLINDAVSLIPPENTKPDDKPAANTATTSTKSDEQPPTSTEEKTEPDAPIPTASAKPSSSKSTKADKGGKGGKGTKTSKGTSSKKK